MEYKQYEIIREQKGNSCRWHVYTQTGKRLTALGFKSLAAAKRFCCDRNVLRIGEYAVL